MSDYSNKNRGSIWKNDKKLTDNHPDFTGGYTDEEGVEFWVSAWKRKPDAKDKSPALTFAMSKKENKKPAPESSSSQQEFDDDIPF